MKSTIKKQYIPYGLFKQKLKSKCEYYGINCIEVDEAYHKPVSPKPFTEALNSSIYNRIVLLLLLIFLWSSLSHHSDNF
ncbi:hypothetical protein DRN63_01980 [Nanoarchaeota archaeon]|nr:MAG: hypothetical protein DRN63_01980 [Nanoarchaeota archaeon]